MSSKKLKLLDSYPFVRLIPDFIYDVRVDMAEFLQEHLVDLSTCSNTYLYDDLVMSQIAKMYKDHKLMGAPINWMRIASFAFFSWLRRKHPGIVANLILESDK